MVLLHELVHVARYDALRQCVCRSALALYWFHPLAWLAAREAALAREQACDEAVVSLGARPSLYAHHLLALADSTGPPSAGVPLTGRSELEHRITAILVSRRSRTRRPATQAAALCASVWVLAVAAVKPSGASQVSSHPSDLDGSVDAVLTQDAAVAPPTPRNALDSDQRTEPRGPRSGLSAPRIRPAAPDIGSANPTARPFPEPRPREYPVPSRPDSPILRSNGR